MSESTTPKRKVRKWPIALLAAGLAALEVAGPQPVARFAAQLLRGLIAPRPSGYPDAPPAELPPPEL